MKKDGLAERRFLRKSRKPRSDKGKARRPYVRRKKEPIAVTHTPEEMLRLIVLGTDDEMYEALEEAREYFRIPNPTARRER